MLTLIVCLMLAAQDRADGPAKMPTAFETLDSQYEAAEAEWTRTYDKVAGADQGKPELVFRFGEWPAFAYAPKYLALAEADPKSEDALKALARIGKFANAICPGDRELFAVYSRALDLIAEHHLDSPKLKERLPDLTFPRHVPAWERLFRKLASEAKDRDVRGIATLALGRMLGERVLIRRDPWYERREPKPFDAYVRARLDPEFRRYIAETDPKTARDEAIALITRAGKDYGDVPYRNTTLAKLSDAFLVEVPSAEEHEKSK